jgi:hypothetical protein
LKILPARVKLLRTRNSTWKRPSREREIKHKAATLRTRSLSPTEVTLSVQEEVSGDDETTHAAENIGYLAIWEHWDLIHEMIEPNEVVDFTSSYKYRFAHITMDEAGDENTKPIDSSDYTYMHRVEPFPIVGSSIVYTSVPFSYNAVTHFGLGNGLEACVFDENTCTNDDND